MDHVFQLVKIFFPLLHPFTLYLVRIVGPRDSDIQARKFVTEHDYKGISYVSKKNRTPESTIYIAISFLAKEISDQTCGTKSEKLRMKGKS